MSAAAATPSPGTPSMLAISSSVISSLFDGSRSTLRSSQRHSCCSSEWCRLQTAVAAAIELLLDHR
jgi:hypothetical protein